MLKFSHKIVVRWSPGPSKFISICDSDACPVYYAWMMINVYFDMMLLYISVWGTLGKQATWKCWTVVILSTGLCHPRHPGTDIMKVLGPVMSPLYPVLGVCVSVTNIWVTHASLCPHPCGGGGPTLSQGVQGTLSVNNSQIHLCTVLRSVSLAHCSCIQYIQ